MKVAFLLSTLLGATTVLASQTIPTTNYSMDCSDQTFSYNHLKVQSQDDQIKFASSGESGRVYANLLHHLNKKVWARFYVSFSVPANNCTFSSADSKIMTCKIEKLLLSIKDTPFLGGETAISDTIYEEKLTLDYAVIQIRKVDEISKWGSNSSGYELAIASDNLDTAPILTQRYFNGMGGNETNNCTIN